MVKKDSSSAPKDAYIVHGIRTMQTYSPVRAHDADPVPLAEVVGKVLQQRAVAHHVLCAAELGHDAAQPGLLVLLLRRGQLHLRKVLRRNTVRGVIR